MDLKNEGIWDEYKGRIKESWGALTDDDLDRSDGKLDQLIGTIKQKTGEKAEKIETRLSELLDDVRSKLDSDDRTRESSRN